MTETAKIGALMCKVQAELAVGKSEYHQFGGYAYRNAEGILKAAKPIITAEGGWLGIETDTKILESSDWMLTVTATLYASDGTNYSTSFTGRIAESRKGMVDEQLCGSAYSYYLKYALQALFALSDGADDPDSRDNTKQSADATRTPQKPKKQTAKGRYWAACKELAAKTGEDAEAVSAKYMPAEKTDAGFAEAEKVVRAAINGDDYAAEDIEF